MQPFRIQYRKILTFTVFVTTLSFVVILLLFHRLLDAILQVSFITSAMSLFWLFFERFGWRMRLFRYGGWLSSTPDLRGRWEGTLERRGADEVPHPFILELRQTATKLKITTYTTHSVSLGMNADILYEETEEHVVLLYSFACDSRNPLHGVEANTFKGLTILRLSDDGTSRMLTGEYFTNRKPQQTAGYLKLTWRGLTCRGRYE
jgi:hypothetical protein